MELTSEQQRILRHMLGIDKRDEQNPKEYRDYYCANPGDESLHELQRLGMVRMYASRDGYEWFQTTDAGKAEARESQRKNLLPKHKRIYAAFLDVRDCDPDLTFGEFLVHPRFAETRSAA